MSQTQRPTSGTAMQGQSLTLEFLQSLSDAGKREALQTAMAWCSTKELRGFCSGMGVRVRSKQYAVYHTKAGYTELLTQLLRAQSASKGLASPLPAAVAVTPVQRTRKTKNCNLRLLNVLFSEAMAPHLKGMNAEPTQAETAAGAVGGNNPFWTRVRAEFVSSRAEYSHVVFQESCLAGFDLSTPVPHSSAKLSEMWTELWTAYNSALIRFTHATDPGLEFVDCCPSRSDVFYMRCWLNVKPELLTEICAKLPATIDMNCIPTAPAASGNQEGGITLGDEPTERTPTSRKRPHSLLSNMTESVVRDTPRKTAERALLMQSIRHAVEVLAIARGSELDPEVVETVNCELQQCTKRLKSIQQEESKETEIEQKKSSQ
ncbi:unnamed protein product [Phytophthora fragariaefolia]|uniref:Unnamed protein product n=1 Tax=Phytophthora fragariaefolia TaxID=1490495 RepID=A0A9W7CJB0_9STRA|nr:unnamed protein product [Phytophthora fragariaefolia]